MTQEEKWLVKYKEVVDFIKKNHRNPSRHRLEDHNMLSWCKHQRKLLNAGKLKNERIDKFNKLLVLIKDNKRVNQWT